MQFIDKKIEYLDAPFQNFMTALILLIMDFINSKQ